jgi:hypothetical protein
VKIGSRAIPLSAQQRSLLFDALAIGPTLHTLGRHIPISSNIQTLFRLDERRLMDGISDTRLALFGPRFETVDSHVECPVQVERFAGPY